MATSTDTDDAQLPPIPHYFYARADVNDEGVEILCSVHETIDRADLCVGSHETIRRCVFEPLDSERRFRVTHISWLPTSPDDARFLDCAVPRSPFDLPPGQSVLIEWRHIEDDIVSRADGLAEVATMNRALMAQQRDALGEDWAVLVELGQPMQGVNIYLEVTPGRIGSEKRQVEYPIRIVTPTAEEIKAENSRWDDILDEKRFPSRKKEAKKKAAKQKVVKRKAK
jgi:hypothetical protein